MIYKNAFFVGSFLYQLCNSGKKISIEKFPSDTSNFYTLNNNNIGISVKYSEKRSSPWGFTFKKIHQEEYLHMHEMVNHSFVCFVCYRDGIVCLSYKELKNVLDDNFEEAERVTIKRRRGKWFEISGRDGKLKNKISPSEFPNKILKLF